MAAGVWAARALHILAAFWTLGLALLIFADVGGRGLVARPVAGTKEVIQNSIVAITFLQLPLAVLSGSLLRTSIFADILPPVARKALRTPCFAAGAALFLALFRSAWPNAVSAWRIGEYEGEGALRVPIWPVRGAVALMSAACAAAFVAMIALDWRGRLVGENAARGADAARGARWAATSFCGCWGC